jgi:AcrR family transcriptional regulator
MKRPSNRNTKPRSPRAGRRATNRERTRCAILRAALELFSKKGFFRTATKEISRKAGIAEGTLFNYFRTKEDLAIYFFEQEVSELMEAYANNRRLQNASLPEKLFAIVHHHLEQIGPYEEFIGAVYLRALQPSSRLSPLSLDHQALSLKYLRFVREILADSEAKGEIPALGDLGAYAVALFHLAIITYWLQDQSPGKENTLALLDRSLKVATSILRKGRWEW